MIANLHTISFYDVVWLLSYNPIISHIFCSVFSFLYNVSSVLHILTFSLSSVPHSFGPDDSLQQQQGLFLLKCVLTAHQLGGGRAEILEGSLSVIDRVSPWEKWGPCTVMLDISLVSVRCSVMQQQQQQHPDNAMRFVGIEDTSMLL